MTLTQSIKTCFAKYAGFRGRASRSEFWWWTLFVCLIGLLLLALLFTSLGGVAQLSGEDPVVANPLLVFVAFILYFVFSVGSFLPTTAVWVRRFHDINLSGWWFFAYFLVTSIMGGISSFYYIQETLQEVEQLEQGFESEEFEQGFESEEFIWESANEGPIDFQSILANIFHAPDIPYVPDILFSFVMPWILFLLILICFLKKGNTGDNRFGPDPLAN